MPMFFRKGVEKSPEIDPRIAILISATIFASGCFVCVEAGIDRGLGEIQLHSIVTFAFGLAIVVVSAIDLYNRIRSYASKMRRDKTTRPSNPSD